jgi:DNA-binding transcriptional LysR family regulator
MAAPPAVVLAVAADHPLAMREAVPLTALRDQTLVTLPTGGGLRTLLETTCLRAGFTPAVRAETDDVLLLADLARNGLGMALLPWSVASRQRDGLKLLHVRPPDLTRRLVLAWSPNRASAAGLAFLAFAAEHTTPPAAQA